MLNIIFKIRFSCIIQVESSNEILETVKKVHHPREKVKNELHHILDRIFPPLVIRYLLVLQSTFPIQASQTGPEVCNNTMSRESQFGFLFYFIFYSNRCVCKGII